MQTGKEKLHRVQHEFNISPKEFERSHLDHECKGRFKVVVKTNIVIPIDGLGPTLVPWSFIVHCDKCQATFIPDAFMRFLDEKLSVHLILQKGVLTKDQIRFLRLAANVTQEQVADACGATDKSHYLKMESKKYEPTMHENMQVRLKMFYAERWSIKDPKKLWGLNKITTEERVQIKPAEVLPESTKKELAEIIRPVLDERKKLRSVGR
jgi:transcriptional regulator with XRE-family HTH domain